MKNLLICGTSKTKIETSNLPFGRETKQLVKYDVNLFGQTKKQPEIQYITKFVLVTEIGYSHLIRKAKEKYIEYFNTNNSDIIAITNITCLDRIL